MADNRYDAKQARAAWIDHANAVNDYRRRDVLLRLADRSWAYPAAYLGADYSGTHALVASTHRDADSVNRANWRTWTRALEPYTVPTDEAPDSPAVLIHGASHWAVGWYDEMLISRDAPVEALEAVADGLDALADYPVLSDDELSAVEIEDEWQAWDAYGRRETVAAVVAYLRASTAPYRGSDLEEEELEDAVALWIDGPNGVRPNWYHDGNGVMYDLHNVEPIARAFDSEDTNHE